MHSCHIENLVLLVDGGRKSGVPRDTSAFIFLAEGHDGLPEVRVLAARSHKNRQRACRYGYRAGLDQRTDRRPIAGGQFEQTYLRLLGSATDLNAAKRAQHAKRLQQPEHDCDDDDDIQDVLDLSVHGDIGVDEPKQYANDDQDND